MKKFSELKQEAKAVLRPNFWRYTGILALIPTIIFLVMFVESKILEKQEALDSLVTFIINIATIPLEVGIVYITLQLFRGNEIKVKQWFEGYKKFGKVTWAEIVKGFFIGIWFIVPVIMITFIATAIILQESDFRNMGESANSQMGSFSQSMMSSDLEDLSIDKTFDKDEYDFKDDFSSSKPQNNIKGVEFVKDLVGSGIGITAIVLMIVGICISVFMTLKYAMVEYILVERSELKALETLRLSGKIMNGQKWRFFLFSLSFVGWFLLGIITVGIALIWVIPYMQVAKIAFFEEVNTRYQDIIAEEKQI
ncbi:MAG TPA: hypothetical protein DEP72_07075 [Clostridiales bacterium]|nr:MAG: hypothetical protein A2Y18_00610 [Clostridiales bacterium GWD2_32_19]HCC07901.1 hypothetical protein [Clostridiales bacterium]